MERQQFVYGSGLGKPVKAEITKIWQAMASIPKEMQGMKRWGFYKLWLKPDGSMVKRIFSPYKKDGELELASSTNESHWGTFEEVKKAIKENGGNGFAFALCREDNIVCIDIDDAYATKERTELTNKLKEQYKQTYRETSVSGKGIHIFCKGKLPREAKRKTDEIECYDNARFICMTGRNKMNLIVPLVDCQEQLDKTIKEYLIPPPSQTKPVVLERRLPPSINDRDLMDKIRKSKQGAKFDALMQGRLDKIKPTGEPDWSVGDFQLCCILAFWTRDVSQIDRIYRESALYTARRSTYNGPGYKWDKKSANLTYGEITINRAIDRIADYYTGAPQYEKSQKKSNSNDVNDRD